MRIRWSRLAWPGVVLVTGVALFTLYLLLSTRGTWVTSDGAANALQAWDMLHGNLLLHGWTVSDVSFYTTELPEYMLVESIRGLAPQVIHICAALTYTVLVLLAGALAIGVAKGRTALTAVALAITPMLAPEPGNPTGVLLLSPDHVGTSVPLMVTWLIIDRAAGTGTRRLVPVAVGVLLAWTVVADPVAEVIGVAPLVLTCAVRIARARVRHAPLPRFELSLAVAALLSVPAAALATRLIAAAGGWTATPATTSLIPLRLLASHAALTGTGILQLFGADFTSQQTATGTLFAAFHLAGLALAVSGLWLALSRFLRQDLIVQVLAVAIVAILISYLVTYEAQDVASTRDISAVLPFGAVLAGRLLAGGVTRALGAKARLAVVSLCLIYMVMLVVDITSPPVTAGVSRLAVWLAGHDLTSGLAGYWQSNALTVDSDGDVQVRAVDLNASGPVAGSWWEASSAWYRPAARPADFVVGISGPGHPPQVGTLVKEMETLAGRPVRIYFYDGYVIAEWRENLLTRLR